MHGIDRKFMFISRQVRFARRDPSKTLQVRLRGPHRRRRRHPRCPREPGAPHPRMRHGHDDACRIGLNGSRRIRPITPSSSHPPSSPAHHHHRHDGARVMQVGRVRRRHRDRLAVPGYQQALRVDAVRRARHQRHSVLAGHDLELRRVVRVDDGDAVDLVAERLPITSM